MDILEDFEQSELVDADVPAAPATALNELVRAARAHWERRKCVLPGLTLEDPRWLMALELLLAAEEGRAVTVTNLTAAAQVPFSTALRHINAMVEEGLLQRVKHPTDGRVAFVTLSADLARSLTAYLTAMVPPAEGVLAGQVATTCGWGGRGESSEARFPAAEALGPSEWHCIERASGRYVSTILTRGDVAISLVVRRPESPVQDDHAGQWPMRHRLHVAGEDEPALVAAPVSDFSIRL